MTTQRHRPTRVDFIGSNIGFTLWSNALVVERLAAFDTLDKHDSSFTACTGDTGHPDALDMDEVAHDGAVAAHGEIGKGWSISSTLTGLAKDHIARLVQLTCVRSQP